MFGNDVVVVTLQGNCLTHLMTQDVCLFFQVRILIKGILLSHARVLIKNMLHRHHTNIEVERNLV